MRRRPASEITITTDLFQAEIDTLGGVISQVALTQHHDQNDETKPYFALQKSVDRTLIAQAGLLGEGMPNHRTLFQALPGPRELAPGKDKLELQLQATTPNGSTGGADAHLPSRQLRDRRRLRHHQRRGRIRSRPTRTSS